MQDTRKALVLFSGGQDSTTCLAWALERFARVETVGFDYGQRHGVEMQARETVRASIIERDTPNFSKLSSIFFRRSGVMSACALSVTSA